jgi:tRNA(fMet)-specific endonuclease VapC
MGKVINDSSGYLFDSNIVIAILDNDESAIKIVRQAQQEKKKIYFSPIARKAASIQSEQRLKGRKIKTPDTIIIATAFISNLILVSRDSDMSFVTKEYGMNLISE